MAVKIPNNRVKVLQRGQERPVCKEEVSVE